MESSADHGKLESMATEREASKGGNHVGSILHLFDLNAKSRKKLFSSRSSKPENSKQNKSFDGSSRVTWLQMVEKNESLAGSNIKESSDYSCVSSVTDEDFNGTKSPGIVARLMGLDFLPSPNALDLPSTPLSDLQTLPGSCNKSKNLEYHQDHEISSRCGWQEAALGEGLETKKVINRLVQKFQTEILPPKSTKAIPITQQKLLSPIKRKSYIPSRNAAQIMEAAARIIEPENQARAERRLPLAGAPSVPLKVSNVKEKVQKTERSSKHESSKGPGVPGTLKKHWGHSVNKDAASIRIFEDSEESSASVTNTGKTVSLALQAKANVLKRERQNLDSGRSRTLISPKETMEVNPDQLLSSQSATKKSMLMKPLTQNGSAALHQNNQKQNCNVHGGKLPSKSTLQGGKTLSENSSSSERQGSGNVVGRSSVSSRKMTSEVKDEKKKEVPSSSKGATCTKRSIDPGSHSDVSQAMHSKRKDENRREASQSNAPVNVHWNEVIGTEGEHVIFSTFNAPMPGSGPGSRRTNEAVENYNIFPADSTSKRTLLRPDGSMGHKVEGGNTLGKHLDRILEELNRKTDLSQHKTGVVLQHMAPGLGALTSSSMLEEKRIKGNFMDNMQPQPGPGYLLEYQPCSGSNSLRHQKRFMKGQKCEMEATAMDGRNIYADRKPLECLLPSPVTFLDYSSITSSCSSADNVDNKCTGDSASSISAGIPSEKQETPFNLHHCRKPKSWELEYLKEILVNIEPMFEAYALRSTCEVISPHLFYQIESHRSCFNSFGLVPKTIRRLWFDCANEYLGLRFRHYVRGGWQMWAKGLRMVHRKDELAKDIYKEIAGLSATGDLMIDELVNNDMSSKHGRWLTYETEACELGIQIQSRVLNSLVDEVVADILVL